MPISGPPIYCSKGCQKTYTLINHYTDAKDIWDNVKMLLEGSELTKEDRESQLYDDFEHCRQHMEESIHDYYVRPHRIKLYSTKVTIEPVQDLALNVDNVFQAEDYDAFNSNVDEAPTAQTMFMANLSSADPITDEAGPSYDSDILSVVQDHDQHLDDTCAYQEEHVMHDNIEQVVVEGRSKAAVIEGRSEEQVIEARSKEPVECYVLELVEKGSSEEQDKKEVELQLGNKIKALRSDRGGEYLSQEFKDYLSCEAYVKRDSADKLQQRSVKCIFVGYPKETMGYYFYFPPENKVIVARYGDFLERDLISQKFSGRDYDLEDDHMDTLPSENTSEIPVEPESLGLPSELIPVRRSERTTRAPNRLYLNMKKVNLSMRLQNNDNDDQEIFHECENVPENLIESQINH
nr:zinc finger, CCHC-type [Tanacetum cinerariifolium]